MGPKTPSTTTQTNKVELSPEQNKIFGLAFPGIEQYAKNDTSLFPGSALSAFNNNEKFAQAGALTAGGQGQGIANDSAALQHFLLDPSMLSPDSNPFLKASGDAVAHQTTQNLLENILPQIRGGATVASGQYSGGNTREGIAEGQAIGRTSQSISEALSKMYSDSYQNGLKTLTTAQAMTPQVQSSLLFGPTVQGQVGGQQRAMDQAQLDEKVQRYQLQQQLPFLKSQDLLSLISGMPGGQGVSTVTGAQPKSGGLMAGLGGAATGAGLASTLFPAMAAAGPVGAGLGVLAALLMR